MEALPRDPLLGGPATRKRQRGNWAPAGIAVALLGSLAWIAAHPWLPRSSVETALITDSDDTDWEALVDMINNAEGSADMTTVECK